MNSNWLRGSTRGIVAAAAFTIVTFDALAISLADEDASDGIDEAADIDWLEICFDSAAGRGALAAGASGALGGALGMEF